MIGRTNAGGGENLDSAIEIQATDLTDLQTQINALDDDSTLVDLKGMYEGTLTEVNVPEGVTNIRGWCFYNQATITKINLPSSVTSIGWVTDSSGQKIYEGGCFSRCTKLESVNLEGVTDIATFNSLCNDCTSLKTIQFNDNATIANMGDSFYVFYNCRALESINLPNALTVLGNYFFNNCSKLKELKGGWKNITTIGYGSFGSCELLDMPELPEGVVTLENDCFKFCKSLKWKYLPSSITKILVSSFQGCIGLTEMTFKGNITDIRTSAFTSCTNLTKFSFPNNTAVPTLASISAIPNGADFTGIIEVPASLLDTWKASTNWSSLTNANWVALEGK